MCDIICLLYVKLFFFEMYCIKICFEKEVKVDLEMIFDVFY